jgi:hypothetical protein
MDVICNQALITRLHKLNLDATASVAFEWQDLDILHKLHIPNGQFLHIKGPQKTGEESKFK